MTNGLDFDGDSEIEQTGFPLLETIMETSHVEFENDCQPSEGTAVMDAFDLTRNKDPSKLDFDDFAELFSGLRNQIFFYQEYVCPDVDGGCRGIAYRTFNSCRGVNINKNIFMHSDLQKYATPEETKFLFDLTEILNNMTNRTRCKMSSLLTILVRQFFGRQIFQNIPLVPTSVCDFRKFCLTNRNSVMSLMPSELVHKINGHACIKLNDKINHIMGHGIEIDFYDKNTDRRQHGLNGCAAMKKMYTRLKQQNGYTPETKIGYVLLWSDGFQVHHVRTKNNNLWVLTVTFQAPGNMKVSKFHSFILATGLYNWDHTPVVEAYFNELQHIRKGRWRYCGKQKKKIHTMFDLLVYAADHPERCSLAFTRDKGNMGCLWKYSTRVNATLLPSCVECKEKRFQWLNSWYENHVAPPMYVSVCERCQDWNRLGTRKVFRGGLLKGYPISACNGSPAPPKKRSVPTKYLYPARQSFQFLRKGCIYAFYNRATKAWTVANLNAYLQSVGVKDKLITDIHRMADHVRATNSDPMEYIKSELKLPRVWDQPFPMDAFIDSPMHMLFLGVVKSVMTELKQYAISYKKNAAFIQHANELLKSVRDYHTSFCRIELFGKEDSTTFTPGWLSDNYVSFARIMPVVCGILLDDLMTPTDCRDDNVQQAVLQRHEHCKSMLVSCHVMIAHLMYAGDVPTTVIEHHIKVFLQCCNEYEKSTMLWSNAKNAKDEADAQQLMRSEQASSLSDNIYGTNICAIAKPMQEDETRKRQVTQFWETKSNFVSLLNLPKQIESYGPVRHYWEGDQERNIQLFKPLIKCMRKTESYFCIKMRHLQLHHTLELLTMKRVQAGQSDWFFTANKTVRGNNIHIYKSKIALESLLESQTPIVGYRISNSVFVAVGTKNNATMLEVVFDSGSQNTHYCRALFYEPCKIGSHAAGQTHITEMISQLNDTCFIMPTPRKDKKTGNPVAVICSSWVVRHPDGLFRLPRLPASIYRCRDSARYF
jgi:hypothetical protein